MPILVFCPGCFDLLHVGHVRLLQRAREMGDRLIVGLNTDESVRLQGKGPDRPLIDYESRREILEAIRWVDEVIPIVDRTPCELVRNLRPEILVKGPGYARDIMPEAAIVESYGGRVVFLDGPEVSTTRLVTKFRGA